MRNPIRREKRRSPDKSAPKEKKLDYTIIATGVVGSRYHLKSRRSVTLFFRKLSAGFPVQIVREPKNRFDKNACAVFIAKKQVGYIPRYDAKRIAKQLDRGIQYQFYVFKTDLVEGSLYISLVGIRAAQTETANRRKT